jgi:hypothetical protein
MWHHGLTKNYIPGFIELSFIFVGTWKYLKCPLSSQGLSLRMIANNSKMVQQNYVCMDSQWEKKSNAAITKMLTIGECRWRIYMCDHGAIV